MDAGLGGDRLNWISYHRHRARAVQLFDAMTPADQKRHAIRMTNHPDPEYHGVLVWWIVEVKA